MRPNLKAPLLILMLPLVLKGPLVLKRSKTQLFKTKSRSQKSLTQLRRITVLVDEIAKLEIEQVLF